MDVLDGLSKACCVNRYTSVGGIVFGAKIGRSMWIPGGVWFT